MIDEEKSNIIYNAFITDQITKLVPDLVSQQCIILDFGCGDGLLTQFVQKAFFKATVFGVDKAEVVEKTKKEFPEITVLALQEKKLSFADATFDLMYALDVFHHILRTEQALYVKELMRVLKPGGRFILFEVNPYNIFAHIHFKKNSSEKGNTLLSARYAAQLFRKYSCSVITKYYFLSDYLPVWLKDHIQFLPLGSLYSVLVHKS